MAKRKRASPSPTPSDAPDPAERALKNQKRQCTQRIAAAQKPLVAALRLGAGFERQKHSRRKKTAQAKGDEKGLARLEAEYAVLKSLNIEQVADQHLRKTVGKVKSLKDHEALREYIEGIRKGSGDTATLNVLARLYKVAAVKAAVDEAVDDLKGIVGAGEGAVASQNGRDKKAKKTKQPQNDGDEEMLDLDDENSDVFAAFSARIAAPSSGEEDSGDSISGDERPPSIGDSEVEHDPDDDLGAGSENGDEEDSFQGFSEDAVDEDGADIDMQSESDEAPLRKAKPHASASDFVTALTNDSDPSSDPESSDLDELAVKKKKSKATVLEQTTSSNFIPDLSHANYLPGSGSEASDLDEAPRKNRRGQRARQKLAELKYGAKAKHLEKQDMKKGWDPKRGAVSDDRRGKGARGGMKTGRGPQQSGGNAEPLGDKKKNGGSKRDDKGELHPSWQAAKAAKEKKMIKIDLSAQQGKKVVFD